MTMLYNYCPAQSFFNLFIYFNIIHLLMKKAGQTHIPSPYRVQKKKTEIHIQVFVFFSSFI